MCTNTINTSFFFYTCSFVTDTTSILPHRYRYEVADTPITAPANFRRAHLSQMINVLLELGKTIFMYSHVPPSPPPHPPRHDRSFKRQLVSADAALLLVAIVRRWALDLEMFACHFLFISLFFFFPSLKNNLRLIPLSTTSNLFWPPANPFLTILSFLPRA